MKLIPVSEVVYFRADQKYVAVRHLHGTVLIDEALGALEREFAASFIRIHRNTLIAKGFVNGLQKTAEGPCRVVLRGVDERPEVSRRHLAQVKAALAAGG